MFEEVILVEVLAVFSRTISIIMATSRHNVVHSENASGEEGLTNHTDTSTDISFAVSEPSDGELDSLSPKSNESHCSDSSYHEDEESSSDTTPLAKRKKVDRSKRYLEGRARKPYRQTCTSDTSLEGSLLQSSFEDSETISQDIAGKEQPTCESCAPVLQKYATTFKGMVQQGSALKRRKNINPSPRKVNFQHYRDLVKQNEWLRNNIFDPMGNYLFCSTCVHKAFNVSYQRLTRLRNIKKAQFKNPIIVMAKTEVEEQKLGNAVIMPSGCTQSFMLWWRSLDVDTQVSVYFPHERHGLAGRTSNNAKMSAKDDFLCFADINSQPNGRQDDSSSATHYFLP